MRRKNNMQTFEDYLKEIHAKEYMGTDDDMPDAFDDWLGDLSVDDMLEYGTFYGKELLKTKRLTPQ